MMIFLIIIIFALALLCFIIAYLGNKKAKKLQAEIQQIKSEKSALKKEEAEEDGENRLFIRNISHDLKTPITSIKGYACGLLDGVANTPEKQERYARTIYNKACDMDALIDELTIYSKIDTSRIPYDFKVIDIAQFFGGYADSIRDDLESQGIELVYYNGTAEGTKIVGDIEQLRRVLNNIISNSVKYMDKAKGVFAIRLKDADDFVNIEIEDNGKGISKKDLPYIFDRFYRTDSSRTSSTGGSGIGLSIVKKIIEDHGGSIYAASEEGAGTVMHISLRKYIEEPAG